MVDDDADDTFSNIMLSLSDNRPKWSGLDTLHIVEIWPNVPEIQQKTKVQCWIVL